MEFRYHGAHAESRIARFTGRAPRAPCRGRVTVQARAKQLDRETFGSLGFGGAALGNLYAPVPDEVAQDTIRAAVEFGVRYFDTAPHYGFGLSEKRLGQLLRELDPAERLIVS